MENTLFDLSQYRRRQTVTVRVGGLCLGGGCPVRVQSMANTDTNDTEACVAQALRIARAGGELVRFTAQGRREAENLRAIKAGIRAAGCDIPLVADIHFNPEAAFIAATIVEKVRINPGNFVDKPASGLPAEWSEAAYRAEQGVLREKFVRLIDLCKAHGTALRIGVNHGSLSERILARYGDTPQGMVESAMEFGRICVEEGFDQVVFSMKSSNVRVMVHAYRLLVRAMEAEAMAFPLHLGVTEAGDGEAARVKSAAGIGALLADGLGDTIRVSLTEPPENEIPVGRKLVAHFSGRENQPLVPVPDSEGYSAYTYRRRESILSGGIGGERPPVVVASGVCDSEQPPIPAPDFWGDDGEAPLWATLTLNDLTEATLDFLRSNPQQIIVLKSHTAGVAEQRAFFLRLIAEGLKNPVIVHRAYSEDDLETLQLKAAADLGPLFLDGFGDGIWVENLAKTIPLQEVISLSFAILQAARVRISRTEYIACPGCGRTLFDLPQTLRQVREATSHLKGLKIGVMGCIVNGPGEMADADYGYVGAGPGKVTLYKGREVVCRNIPQEEAIARLLEILS